MPDLTLRRPLWAGAEAQGRLDQALESVLEQHSLHHNARASIIPPDGGVACVTPTTTSTVHWPNLALSVRTDD
jgi:hypothetical protein